MIWFLRPTPFTSSSCLHYFYSGYINKGCTLYELAMWPTVINTSISFTQWEGSSFGWKANTHVFPLMMACQYSIQPLVGYLTGFLHFRWLITSQFPSQNGVPHESQGLYEERVLLNITIRIYKKNGQLTLRLERLNAWSVFIGSVCERDWSASAALLMSMSLPISERLSAKLAIFRLRRVVANSDEVGFGASWSLFLFFLAWRTLRHLEVHVYSW